MGRIFNAMAQHPEQVGGDGRFCTILMEAFKGQLFGKVGADACYAIGVKESEATRRLGAKGALGLAVKVYAVVPHLLEQLNIGSPGEREALHTFHDLKMLNSMGVETGTVGFHYKLHSAL
jgi:L-asparaginase II